ncbi:hypothetical protein [Vulcanisaeta souniana]|uniref:hypothetical protein n=1 Tax=Vulcanisaeta souniana TaxID=164452 RepID=UPI000AE4B8AB|nr:hypothetical protein [Vulcanisaeta souniana]
MSLVFVSDYDVRRSPEKYIHRALHDFALAHCSLAILGQPHCGVFLDFFDSDDMRRLYEDVGDYVFKYLMRHIREALVQYLGSGGIGRGG